MLQQISARRCAVRAQMRDMQGELLAHVDHTLADAAALQLPEVVVVSNGVDVALGKWATQTPTHTAWQQASECVNAVTAPLYAEWAGGAQVEESSLKYAVFSLTPK
mgnify:CR=1 FL=1